MAQRATQQGCAGRSHYLQGGARVKNCGAGPGRESARRGKKTRKSSDPKICQKCVNCFCWEICNILPFCVFIQENIAYSNFKDLSANKIINTSCTQGQSISFCFFFFLICVLIVESAVSFATSHPAGFVNFCRAGQGLLFAGRGGVGRASIPFTQTLVLKMLVFMKNKKNHTSISVAVDIISQIIWLMRGGARTRIREAGQKNP